MTGRGDTSNIPDRLQPFQAKQGCESFSGKREGRKKSEIDQPMNGQGRCCIEGEDYVKPLGCWKGVEEVIFGSRNRGSLFRFGWIHLAFCPACYYG